MRLNSTPPLTHLVRAPTVSLLVPGIKHATSPYITTTESWSSPGAGLTTVSRATEVEHSIRRAIVARFGDAPWPRVTRDGQPAGSLARADPMAPMDALVLQRTLTAQVALVRLATREARTRTDVRVFASRTGHYLSRERPPATRATVRSVAGLAIAPTPADRTCSLRQSDASVTGIFVDSRLIHLHPDVGRTHHRDAIRAYIRELPDGRHCGLRSLRDFTDTTAAAGHLSAYRYGRHAQGLVGNATLVQVCLHDNPRPPLEAMESVTTMACPGALIRARGIIAATAVFAVQEVQLQHGTAHIHIGNFFLAKAYETSIGAVAQRPIVLEGNPASFRLSQLNGFIGRPRRVASSVSLTRWGPHGRLHDATLSVRCRPSHLGAPA